jgi:hypothetical protein
MKTTLEIPDSLFRQAKIMAVNVGITMKQLFTEALEDRLSCSKRPEKAVDPPWMNGFGGLSDLKKENARTLKVIEDEFEQIDPDD